MAEFEIERRHAKFPASIEALEPQLQWLRKRRLGGDADRDVFARRGVILEPQFLYYRNRVLLKGVVDRAVVADGEGPRGDRGYFRDCLLYTSDAADE